MTTKPPAIEPAEAIAIAPMTSREELLSTLADWLLYMQVQNETSVCANDPVIKTHIENLKKWQQVIRNAPAQAAPIRADIAEIISEGWWNGKSAAEVADNVLREFDMPSAAGEPQTPLRSALEQITAFTITPGAGASVAMSMRRIAGAALAAPHAQCSEETAWLIEVMGDNGTPTYHQLKDDDDWTFDANKALRFARREDAQAYIDNIGWTSPKPVEHMWCPVSRPHRGVAP